jgi:hypothetical protein
MTQPSDHELGYTDVPYWPDADPTPLAPNDAEAGVKPPLSPQDDLARCLTPQENPS